MAIIYSQKTQTKGGKNKIKKKKNKGEKRNGEINVCVVGCFQDNTSRPNDEVISRLTCGEFPPSAPFWQRRQLIDKMDLMKYHYSLFNIKV